MIPEPLKHIGKFYVQRIDKHGDYRLSTILKVDQAPVADFPNNIATYHFIQESNPWSIVASLTNGTFIYLEAVPVSEYLMKIHGLPPQPPFEYFGFMALYSAPDRETLNKVMPPSGIHYIKYAEDAEYRDACDARAAAYKAKEEAYNARRQEYKAIAKGWLHGIRYLLGDPAIRTEWPEEEP